MVNRFNPEIYNSLVEIDEVKTKEGYNKALLPNIGKVIKKYGWENEVIVSLAHRHFDLQPDERMVADYDLAKKEWISKPIVIDESKLIPWNWKVAYDSDRFKWKWYPLDFLYDIPKFAKEKKIVSKLIIDEIFLEELSVSIAREGAADVFGMALLMSRFNDLTSDVVMFEKNDKVNRVSNSFFIPTKGLDNPEAITQWHFRNSNLYKVGPGPLRWCDHI